MKTRKVTRHYCDHCGKGMFFRNRAVKHENGCTANPDRNCGVCGVKRDLSELKRWVMTQREPHPMQEDFCGLGLEATAFLRDKCDNCPACMLAVLRQTQTFAHNFTFKDEMAEWWAEKNNEIAMKSHYY